MITTLKGGPNPKPPDGTGCTSVTSSPEEPDDGEAMVSTSYASVAQRRFPGLVLDFAWEKDHEQLSPTKLAAFLREDLKLHKGEISRIRKMGGSLRACTIKVETVKDIIISERFGSNVAFQRQFDETTWKCTIRGGDKKSKLRFLNVPEGVNNSLLVDSLRSFAKPVSDITEERFSSNHDSWLAGIPNGNMQVMVITKDVVPDFVHVGPKRIRIVHKNQTKKCFLCGSGDHLRNDCPRNIVTGDKEPHVDDQVFLPPTNNGSIAKEVDFCEAVTSLSVSGGTDLEEKDLSNPKSPSHGDFSYKDSETTSPIENGKEINKFAGTGKKTNGREYSKPKRGAFRCATNGSGISTRSQTTTH